MHARGNPLVSHERGEQVRPREHLLPTVARGLVCRAFDRAPAASQGQGTPRVCSAALNLPASGKHFQVTLLPNDIAMTEWKQLRGGDGCAETICQGVGAKHCSALGIHASDLGFMS